MERFCIFCQKNRAGEPKDISFEYEGFSFTIFKDGLTCIECAKRMHIEMFTKFGKELVKKEGGKVKVNWSHFVETEQQAREGTFSEVKLHRIIEILITLNVLSYDREGNWDIITSAGFSLVPFYYIFPIYFIREEDAMEYAQIALKNTSNWRVIHINTAAP
jgi:hypothetical protein